MMLEHLGEKGARRLMRAIERTTADKAFTRLISAAGATTRT